MSSQRNAGRPPANWLTDDPIDDLSQDALGRGPFVRRVVSVLGETVGLSTSTVVGLTGPWGSGKSSSVRLVLAALDRSRLAVREVNPWGVSGPAALTAEILGAISSAFPARRTRKLRKALTKYSVLASPLLSALPVAGGVASELVGATSSLLAGDETLAGRSTEVREMLEALKRPVLVVLDDIDRLQPDELLALFKTVRLLGRLPYVHYLLAYDDRTVRQLIMSTPTASGDPGRAEAFMEKLINVRIDQPPTRREQARTLFETRLSSLLTDHDIKLSQQQQVRLREEHERLLAATLREPRAIGRFFAQLHMYLPLIGPNEIDLADFVGLTTIRMSFPGLYDSLSEDRQTLVGESIEGYDNPLGSWRPLDAKLDGLEVPPDRRATVTESLELLFPRLSPSYHASPTEQADRKRNRRISDGDYVNRYFALLLPDDELPDATISSALEEWIIEQPRDAVAQVRHVLASLDETADAHAKRAATLRRIEAKSATLSPDETATILVAATRLLNEMQAPLVDIAIDWLAALFQRSEPVPPEAILDIVSAPITQPSNLWPLLLAVSRATGPADGHRGDLAWLARVSAVLIDAAWHRFLAQVALSDAAPKEAALGYVIQAAETLGDDEVNRRLTAALDASEVKLSDLAARFVNVGNYLNDYREFVVDFAPDELANRLGWDALATRVAELVEGAQGYDELSWNFYDTSWANLRRLACARLVQRLEREPITLPALPAVPDSILNEVRNQTASALTPGQADLQFTAALFVPSTAVRHEPLPADEFDHISASWQRVLSGSSLASWLSESADEWHAVTSPWESGDSDGRTYQQSRATLRQIPNEQGQDMQDATIVEIAARVQFATLAVNQSRQLSSVLTVELGFRLAKLDEHRRLTEAQSAARPLPSALSLSQVWRPLSLLVQAALEPALRPELGIDGREEPLVLHLAGTTMGGLDSVLDLRDLRRDTRRSAAQGSSTVQISARPQHGAQLVTSSINPDVVLADLFRGWLRDNGYRDLETAIRRASAAEKQVRAHDETA